MVSPLEGATGAVFSVIVVTGDGSFGLGEVGWRKGREGAQLCADMGRVA